MDFFQLQGNNGVLVAYNPLFLVFYDSTNRLLLNILGKESCQLGSWDSTSVGIVTELFLVNLADCEILCCRVCNHHSTHACVWRHRPVGCECNACIAKMQYGVDDEDDALVG